MPPSINGNVIQNNQSDPSCGGSSGRRRNQYPAMNAIPRTAGSAIVHRRQTTISISAAETNPGSAIPR